VSWRVSFARVDPLAAIDELCSALRSELGRDGDALDGVAALRTASLPAYRRYVEDEIDGVLVPAHDPEALAGVVNDLLGDDDRRRRIGRQARERYERQFTGAHLWQAVDEVLRSAVSR